jgi:hypothetical protein
MNGQVNEIVMYAYHVPNRDGTLFDSAMNFF